MPGTNGTFDGAVDLAALGDYVGPVLILNGHRLRVRNPNIGILRKIDALQKGPASVDKLDQIEQVMRLLLPQATDDDINAITPTIVELVIETAVNPSAVMATYGRLADPNGMRGPASSSVPETGPVTSSGESPAPPGATPIG